MSLIVIDNDKPVLSFTTAMTIAKFEKQAKYIEEQKKALREAIQKEMEALGIVKLETEELTINYIAPSDRERFDSEAFRRENPNLYDEYVTMSPVKASVRIKLKEEKK